MPNPLNRVDLEARLQVAQSLAVAESSLSLRGYLNHVVVNSSPTPRRFGSIVEPWQQDLWRTADQALEAVAFGKPYQGPHGFWRTLPRGHDKTSAIARRLSWLLTFANRELSLITAAADQEQAGLITESMRIEVDLNPWLPVKVTSKGATGPRGRLKVLSSDAPTSWGLGADVYVIDELTWWKKPDLWQPLVSAWRKRPGAILIIITNAGVLGSWQHDQFLKVTKDPQISNDWDVYESPVDTFLASWMGPERVRADEVLFTPAIVKRVFRNRWIEPGEESGYLTRSEIQACEEIGASLGLTMVTQGTHGIDYVVGVDYGPKRDRTALSVVHHAHDGHIHIDELTVLQGSPDNPVKVAQVEEWIQEINRRFYRPFLVIDPYQMEGTVQRYEYHNRIERFEARGGKANYEMASTLRSLIANKRLIWYPGAGDLVTLSGVETFADELARLVIVPTSYGYRFDHTAQFHDDRSVSVGMASLHAARLPPAPKWLPPTPVTRPPRQPHLLNTLSTKLRRSIWGT